MPDTQHETAIEAAAEDLCGGEHKRFGFRRPDRSPCPSCRLVARAAIAAYNAARSGERSEADEQKALEAAYDAANEKRRQAASTTFFHSVSTEDFASGYRAGRAARSGEAEGLEAAGEGMAVVLRGRLSAADGEGVEADPDLVAALASWNAARNALRPGAALAEHLEPGK